MKPGPVSLNLSSTRDLKDIRMLSTVQACADNSICAPKSNPRIGTSPHFRAFQTRPFQVPSNFTTASPGLHRFEVENDAHVSQAAHGGRELHSKIFYSVTLFEETVSKQRPAGIFLFLGFNGKLVSHGRDAVQRICVATRHAHYRAPQFIAQSVDISL